MDDEMQGERELDEMIASISKQTQHQGSDEADE